MSDIAEERSIKIKSEQLSTAWGVPVISINARSKNCEAQIKKALVEQGVATPNLFSGNQPRLLKKLLSGWTRSGCLNILNYRTELVL